MLRQRRDTQMNKIEEIFEKVRENTDRAEIGAATAVLNHGRPPSSFARYLGGSDWKGDGARRRLQVEHYRALDGRSTGKFAWYVVALLC